MNRKTALLLALAALLAHALALHQDAAGGFAPPHESAHVAYRLARQWVQHDVLAWGVASAADGSAILRGGLESHPSPLLVLFATFAERVYFPVTGFCQFLGLLAGLGCVWFSASFATNRSAGIVPPLLLVLSGGFAAAAASGTELALCAFGITGAFVAFEQRNSQRFAFLLAWLAACRPEGALFVGAFALLYPFGARQTNARGRRLRSWSFLPALAVLALLFAWRARDGSSLYGAFLVDLFTPEEGRLAQGLAYGRDGFVATGVPLLLVFPLVALLLRCLSGLGVRALAGASLWCVAILLEGGAEPEFSLGFVPALPLLSIAIQQGILSALDTYKRPLELLSWAALISVVAISALVSKFPGDLGPIPAEAPHRAWMRGSTRPLYGRPPTLGRVSLREQILLSCQLRELGAWMQQHLPPERSILTPWPGAIGYLSRARVWDLFGRLDRGDPAAGGRTSLTRWWRRSVDVVAALEERPDYLVIGMLTMNVVRSRSLPDALAGELSALDLAPGDRVRKRAMRAVLEEYELVAVPPTSQEASARMGRQLPFFLLRRRAIGPQLVLSARLVEGRLTVDLEPRGEVRDQAWDPFPRLARLRILGRGSDGSSAYLNPRGGFSGDPRISARVNLLLRPGADRPTRLFEGELGAFSGQGPLRQLRAELWNPGTRGAHTLSRIGRPAILEL